jgi:hypothetical protein
VQVQASEQKKPQPQQAKPAEGLKPVVSEAPKAASAAAGM